MKPLVIQRQKKKLSRLRWFGHLIKILPGASLWRLFQGTANREEPPGADPERAGGTAYVIWPQNASGSPQEDLESVAGEEGKSEIPC